MDTRRKIVDWDKAAREARRVRDAGGKVVFTNGCFDILHAGHVRYLNQARELGDMLILGLNTDASVRGLNKAPDRPLNGQELRAEVVGGLAAVDLVVLFDQPTPRELIAAVEPDVLVKGGDWAVADIVGGDLVAARGGRVLSIPMVSGLSTTGLVERIRRGA